MIGTVTFCDTERWPRAGKREKTPLGDTNSRTRLLLRTEEIKAPCEEDLMAGVLRRVSIAFREQRSRDLVVEWARPMTLVFQHPLPVPLLLVKYTVR